MFLGHKTTPNKNKNYFIVFVLVFRCFYFIICIPDYFTCFVPPMSNCHCFMTTVSLHYLVGSVSLSLCHCHHIVAAASLSLLHYYSFTVTVLLPPLFHNHCFTPSPTALLSLPHCQCLTTIVCFCLPNTLWLSMNHCHCFMLLSLLTVEAQLIYRHPHYWLAQCQDNVSDAGGLISQVAAL